MLGKILAVAIKLLDRSKIPFLFEVAIELRREDRAKPLPAVFLTQAIHAGIAFLAGGAPVRAELKKRHGTGHCEFGLPCRHVQPTRSRDGSSRRSNELQASLVVHPLARKCFRHIDAGSDSGGSVLLALLGRQFFRRCDDPPGVFDDAGVDIVSDTSHSSEHAHRASGRSSPPIARRVL